VTLKIKTDGKAGEQVVQNATVYTNDPERPKIILTLIGDVIPAADIDPKAARLMGTAGGKIQADVTIVPPKDNLFEITDVEAEEGGNIRFHLEKMTDKVNRKFILHVENIKPDPGRYFDKIVLKTTSAISPELYIRVFGIIRDPAEGDGPSEKK
jgi:hypothetical protein